MIRSYFKIAWRNIWGNKLFSFINILSLAIGLSASFCKNFLMLVALLTVSVQSVKAAMRNPVKCLRSE